MYCVPPPSTQTQAHLWHGIICVNLNIFLFFQGKVKREDLFIVTKLPMFAMQPKVVSVFFEKSRKALGLDYIDLYLIHGPIGCERDEKTDWMKLYDGMVPLIETLLFHGLYT